MTITVRFIRIAVYVVRVKITVMYSYRRICSAGDNNCVMYSYRRICSADDNNCVMYSYRRICSADDKNCVMYSNRVYVVWMTITV